MAKVLMTEDEYPLRLDTRPPVSRTTLRYRSLVFRKIAAGQSSNSTSAVRAGRAPCGPVTVKDAA
jgi:hypothetical protein